MIGFTKSAKPSFNDNSSNFAILLTGFTATGKSTLAKILEKKIQENVSREVIVYHSAKIRTELGLNPSEGLSYDFNLSDPVFTEVISSKVYGEMAKRGELNLKRGKIVIFDAAYNFYWQRNLIYQIVVKMKNRLIGIKTICQDENEIRRRLSARNFSSDPLDEASKFKTYLSTKFHAENILNDFQNISFPFIFFEVETFQLKFSLTHVYNAEKNKNLEDLMRKILETCGYVYVQEI